MISIYINNQLADYFGDITIKKDNPLFSNFDKEPTEHTYTLTLPTTATNAKIFSLIQHTLATPKKLSARIEVDGVQVLDGSCNVQSWSESGYSVYFSGIAPYEDANISHIKKMLGDTTTLPIILRNTIDGYDNFANDNGFNKIYLTDTDLNGVIYNAVAKGNNIVLKRENFDMPADDAYAVNFVVSSYFLIKKVAQYYGIKIKSMPNDLKGVWLYVFDKPEWLDSEDMESPNSFRISSSAPMWTAKELLLNMACAISCKIEFDYKANVMSFFDIADFPTTSTKPLSAESYSLDFVPAKSIKGVVKFAQFDQEKEVTDEEGNKLTQIVPFSNTSVAYDINAEESESEDKKESIYYENIAGIATLQDGKIVAPYPYATNEYYINLKGKVILCEFISNNIYPPSIVDNIFKHHPFELYEAINARPSIKCKVHLSPLELINVDYWKPVFIENIGNIYIKSISFKSGGESELEGYLI